MENSNSIDYVPPAKRTRNELACDKAASVISDAFYSSDGLSGISTERLSAALLNLVNELKGE